MWADSRSAIPTYIKSLGILGISSWPRPADDHIPDPEGTLSSKLPSLAIASTNSVVRFVIDSDSHPPFSNTCIYSLFGTAPPHATFKCIDCVEKFTKLSSTKLIFLLIRQTLIPPNFCCLRYIIT